MEQEDWAFDSHAETNWCKVELDSREKGFDKQDHDWIWPDLEEILINFKGSRDDSQYHDHENENHYEAKWLDKVT